MNLNDALPTFGFLCIFQIMGGAALGTALRHLLRSEGGNNIFLLIWGGMFGLVPLVIGLFEFPEMGAPIFIGGQLVVLLGTILIAGFIPSWTLDTFQSPSVRLILFGGLFLLIGIGVGLATMREEIFTGSILLCTFGGTGLLILGIGLRMLFTEK